MMDHLTLDDLSARLDGELTDARILQIDAHLVACDQCRAAYETLRWTVDFTRALPKTPLPPGVSLHVPIQPAATLHRWRPAGTKAMALAVTAMAAVALLGLVVASRLPGDAVRQLALEQGSDQRTGGAARVGSDRSSRGTSDSGPSDGPSQPGAFDATGAADVVDEAAEVLGRSEGTVADSQGTSLGPEVGSNAAAEATAPGTAGAGFAAADADAVATRQSLVDDAPVWQALEAERLQSSDSESAGYPRPLATARELQLRELGAAVPPPEIGLLTNRRATTAANILEASGSERGLDESAEGPGAITADDRHRSSTTDQPPLESSDVSGATDAEAIGELGVALATRDASLRETAMAGETGMSRAEGTASTADEVGPAGPVAALAPRAGEDEETGRVEAPAAPVASDAEAASAAPTRGQPVPIGALVGIALAFVALSVLLLARHRRQRRYR